MKIFKDFKGIKFKTWIFGLVSLLLQFSCYLLTNLINILTGSAEGSIAPKIDVIDDAIPFVKIFILIYVFSFYFWISNATLIIGKSKKSYILNCFIALYIAQIICNIIFLVFPTHIDRVAEGVLANIQSNSFIDFLCRYIFKNDGWEIGRNLFPSMHCLDAIFYCIVFHKQKEFSKGHKIYSYIIGILICASTVLTKQHYFVDVISGAGLAIICYIIVQKWNPGEKIEQKGTSFFLKLIDFARK